MFSAVVRFVLAVSIVVALVIGASCGPARGQICDTGDDCPADNFCTFGLSDGCNGAGLCTPRTSSTPAANCGMTQYCGCSGETVFDSCLLSPGVVEQPVVSAMIGPCVDAGTSRNFDGSIPERAAPTGCPDGCVSGNADSVCDSSLSCYCSDYPSITPTNCSLGATSVPAPYVAIVCCD